MAKVHVIGAGPAGSIAAISAIRSGHSVHVSEEHSVSGIPENCSGLFSKDGLESLAGFFDYRKFIVRPILGADIYLMDQKLSVRKKEPIGFVCDRSGIDLALSQKAESAGAKIAYGQRVNEDFKSENIIGADGPLSSVASRFQFPRIQRFASTLQAVLRYKSEDPDAVEVFLSNSRFPGFFGWVIPKDEESAEFGVGVELPHRAADAWASLLKMKRMAEAPKPKGALIPLAIRQKTAMRKGKMNILLAGDSAGQVKATTGGGVIFGGNCAALAGKYVGDPLRYELEWRTRFSPDLSIHSALHSYLAGLSDAELSLLGRRLKRLDLDGYLSAHGHMDKPTKMLGPGLLAHIIRNFIGFG